MLKANRCLPSALLSFTFDGRSNIGHRTREFRLVGMGFSLYSPVIIALNQDNKWRNFILATLRKDRIFEIE